MLVAASAMSPASGASGRGGVAGAPGPAGGWAGGAVGAAGGGVPAPAGAPGAFGSPIAGESAVGGSPLPPDISAVLASDVVEGGGVSSSTPLNGGANTVCGSGTERSSPASALVSVPAQGVAPAGTPGALGAPDAPASAPEPPADDPEPAAGHPAPLPDEPPAGDGPDAAGAAGTPACVWGSAPPEPPAPPVAPASPSPRRRSGIPIRSAASCNHSGGLSKKDV